MENKKVRHLTMTSLLVATLFGGESMPLMKEPKPKKCSKCGGPFNHNGTYCKACFLEKRDKGEL